MRAARAEVGRALGQRGAGGRGAAALLLQQPRRSVALSGSAARSSTRPEGAGHVVGAGGGPDGHQRTALLVVLADHQRRVGRAVQRLLDQALHERRACPRPPAPSPRRRSGARSSPVSSGQGMPSCTTRRPRASQRGLAEARGRPARAARPGGPCRRRRWRCAGARARTRPGSGRRRGRTGAPAPGAGSSGRARPPGSRAAAAPAARSRRAAAARAGRRAPRPRPPWRWRRRCRPRSSARPTGRCGATARRRAGRTRPARPRSPGASTGSIRLRHIGSHELGTVEDLAAGSSPISATAPPSGAVPDRLPWRMASAARSRPGLLPYQKPVTPSWRRPSSSPSSWVPATAVAASSSFSPGWKTMPAGPVCSAARASSLSRPPSGEPW